MSDTGSDSDDGGISRTRHLPPEDADGDGDMEEVNLNINDQSQALPPLSLSILGVEPIDEFIREVADFISHMITTKPDHLRGSIEVEAKVGILRDRNSGQRLSLPVLVESILAPNFPDIRFESNMSAMQHKHYNTLLNKLKMQPPPQATSAIEYKHQYLIDSFYPSDNDRDKIRVTRDEKTKEVVECLKKVRLGDINIYSPKRAADWRVSVNVEVPVSHPVGSPSHTRRKDRISYSHEEFVIDLTQVVTSRPGGPPETLHELEVEFARPALLLASVARRNDPTVSEPERSTFDELVRAFVNNARILVRNANSGGWA